MNFLTKNYTNNEALDIVNSTYKNLVNSGGPWAFRMFQNYMKSYSNLRNSHNHIFRERASQCKNMLFPLSVLAVMSIFFFYGYDYRKKWRKSMKDFLSNFPHLMILSILLLPFACLFILTVYAISNLIHYLSYNGDQPDFLRKEYK